MFSKAIQTLILVLGIALISPLSMASEQSAVSASTTFSIRVYIAPSDDFNPQLSRISLNTGSNENCMNTLEETGLSVERLDPNEKILARNFFCSAGSEHYQTAEQTNAIILTAIPV